MTRKTYEYVECNGCFQQQRLETSFMVARNPEGWVQVYGRYGDALWDLCASCFKEVAGMLFDKERINRVLAVKSSECS